MRVFSSTTIYNLNHIVMKKFLTLSLFLFTLLSVHGQYMSFFGDSTWEYHITYLTNPPEDYINYPPEIPNPLGVYCKTVVFSYSKNDHTYWNAYMPTILGDLKPGSVFLQEDTAFGRLYNGDCIYCDMSLSIGDTFILPTLCEFSEDRTMIVDSIYYAGGRKIIHLSLLDHLDDYFFGPESSPTSQNFNISIYFIEGVGATYGFNPGCPGDHFYTPDYMMLLLCLYKDGALFYMTNEALGCEQRCVGIHDPAQPIINLYPNPATKYVVLDMSSGEEMNGTVTITDMMGRVCHQQKAEGTDCRIAVSDLPTGMYFLTYTDGKKKVTKKFLKK